MSLGRKAQAKVKKGLMYHGKEFSRSYTGGTGEPLENF
jgi:hypothetical protein